MNSLTCYPTERRDLEGEASGAGVRQGSGPRPRNLRVLLVTEASGAGVGRHVVDLARGLRRGGQEAHVLYSPLRMDTAFREAVGKSGALSYRTVPMRRDINPGDAGALWRILSYTRRVGPFDVIHGHSSKGGGLARLAAFFTGTTCVYTPHAISTMSPDFGAAKRRLFVMIEQILARRTDAIIAVSEEERAHISTIGLRPRRLLTIPNGLRPIAFPKREAARRRLGLDEAQTVIGSIGRLSKQKAPELLLRAFASFRRQGAGTVLSLVGGGELLEPLRALARELGVADSVLFLGEQPGWQVLPAFDLFALSSNYEGMPYVLLEAAAAGLPIVTTAVGGASLVVQDGVNGRIVPTGDTHALSEALADLLRDPERLREFGARSVTRASAFTVDRMVERTLALYREIADCTPRLCGSASG